MADPESGYREATEKSLAHERAAQAARYARTWMRLRVAWWLWFGSGLAFIPGLYLTAFFGNASLVYAWFAIISSAFLAGGHYALHVVCPRCRRRFWGGFWPLSLWLRGCRNCGLPFGATHDPNRPDE